MSFFGRAGNSSGNSFFSRDGKVSIIQIEEEEEITEVRFFREIAVVMSEEETEEMIEEETLSLVEEGQAILEAMALELGYLKGVLLWNSGQQP